jgi:hypothetical protein
MTNRDLSNSKCFSISGRVPFPIEPNPIMTIGPVMRACTDEALDDIIYLQIFGKLQAGRSGR